MCEIEISHMGKNNGNPDLVYEKELSHMGKNNGYSELVCKKRTNPMAEQIRRDLRISSPLYLTHSFRSYNACMLLLLLDITLTTT